MKCVVHGVTKSRTRVSGFPQQDKWQPRGFVLPFLSSLGVIISRSVPVAADGVISSPSTERRDFRPVVTEAFKPRRGTSLELPGQKVREEAGL